MKELIVLIQEALERDPSGLSFLYNKYGIQAPVSVQHTLDAAAAFEGFGQDLANYLYKVHEGLSYYDGDATTGTNATTGKKKIDWSQVVSVIGGVAGAVSSIVNPQQATMMPPTAPPSDNKNLIMLAVGALILVVVLFVITKK